MSRREERKMAQLIASLERLEQHAGAPQSAAEHPAGARSAAGSKRGRKDRASKSKRLSIDTASPVEPDEGVHVTPKKRWMQRWSAMRTLGELVVPSSSAREELRVVAPVTSPQSQSTPVAMATAPVSTAVISPAPKASEQADATAAPYRGKGGSVDVKGEPEEGEATQDEAHQDENSQAAANQCDTGRSRPGDDGIQLTESELQRLERRKRRKTKWDVGDPRRGGQMPPSNNFNPAPYPSPNAPFQRPPFYQPRFPRGRPAWRHSHSFEDKPFHRVIVLVRLLALLLSLKESPRCAAASVRTPPPPLFIVGDVSATSARILYDRLPAVAETVVVRVHVATTNASLPPTAYRVLHELSLPFPAADRPEVLALRDLLPHHHYIVSFLMSPTGRHEEIVRFRTPATSSTAAAAAVDPQRVLVVSCDRFVDDRDDALWLRLADDLERHRDVHVGMAHIGDQVYVDSGAVQVSPVPLERLEEPELLRVHYETVVVAAFRSVYRETFGRAVLQRVLRQGAHWMVPDDHEVVNNLNRASVRRVFAPRGQDEDDAAFARRLAWQLHYRAGLQTIYEYQYQLRRDIAWAEVDFFSDPYAAILSAHPLYFAVEMPPLQLYFLDVRFDPSVAERDDESDDELLVSATQLNDVRQQLEQWRRRGRDGHVVVLASVPLFFHSALTADIAFGVEREVYPGHVATRRAQQELLDVLLAHPENSTLRLLVGGDVHMLAHTQVCASSASTTPPLCVDQLVTSGVTRRSTAIEDPKLLPFYLLLTRLEPLRQAITWWRQRPWRLHASKVFFGRNYGESQFEWRRSVEYPHASWPQQAVQSLLDAWPLVLTLLTAGAALVVRALFGCLGRCCGRRRASKATTGKRKHD
ncbi:hypothetical protein P43SY_003063 [Pythium insidiosum]|uniref:PhoD-like phosphatase metallophosphatase domain-containing protein n=1 Tax=Pythium insidiosum TaxID=114742 RepID=A0AAD5Q9C5_PYTIN|nr:hypothetical protein P43SY_003063 [Pythium insidiosum]